MVVDLAHPDCGLLSLSVVHPLREQRQHRDEGGRGGWRDGGYGMQLSLRYKKMWREGFALDRETAALELGQTNDLLIPHFYFLLCYKLTVNKLFEKA